MVYLYTISDKVLVGKKINYLVAYLSEALFKHNFKIAKRTTVGYLDNYDELFNNQKDGDVNIILVDKANLNLNNSLCKIFDCVLVDNPYAKNAIFEFYRKQNTPIDKDSEIEWRMPANARCIVNPNGIVQGYFVVDKQITYVVLPNNFEQACDMFDNIVLDELIKKQKKKYRNFTFKTFGLTESNLRVLLQDYIKNKEKISINFFEKDLEVDIVVKANEENRELDNFAQKIFMKLGNYIYAVEDIPIVKVAYNLLNMNGISIAFAEDVTGGNVCQKLCNQSANAKNHVHECLVLSSKQSKINRLGINPKTIDENGEISANVAYEMAANLIATTSANVVVATLGVLEKNSNLPIGLNYIAVGDKKEIHVYKNLFNGSTTEIIESITNASYFYLIKKLKKNDFHLEQSTI